MSASNIHSAANPHGQSDGSSSIQGRPLSLRKSCQSFGLRLRLLAPLIVIGLGTTGSKLAALIVQLVLRETNGQMPRSLNHLLIDAATDDTGLDSICVSTVGAGTDPNEGKRAFLSQEGRIASALSNHLVHLDHTDPLAPADLNRKEATQFLVCGGCGGSSGGMLLPMLSVCEKAANGLTNEPRIEVVLITPEVASKDVSRTVEQELYDVMQDTMSLNLSRLVHDFFTRPRSAAFSIADQTNGSHTLNTVDDFLAMAARSLLLSSCTHAGKFIADRVEDPNRIGLTGLGCLHSP